MYERELKKAKQAAVKAGEAVMEVYNSDFKVDYKEGENPVTKADLLSEKIILEELTEFNYGILSEETSEENDRLNKDRVWIIDPLDGTSDFVDRTGEFVIMIALAEKGKPVLGVIYQPVSQALYFACAGGRACLEIKDRNNRMQSSRTKDLEQALMLNSRFHLSQDVINFADKNKIRQKTCGSAGLKICLIAAGKADVNINTSGKTSEYDICAADIILKKAGGRLTDMAGKEFIYNKKNPRNLNGYVASNGLIHDRVIRALK
ncbi:MAG: 3'(2'),5'-bisphosphate nucleotidase CysQ [Patescibacteria group bacterium]|nr:3'(2'),5'-bisphosphate nucleotidase CysQ [Patescibacteria group bacterium]